MTPARKKSASGPDFSATLHELSERLTAVAVYLTALSRRREAGAPDGSASADSILDKALAQATQAGDALRHLRDLLEAQPGTPACRQARRHYRVSFLNEVANAGGYFRPCQRSLVIRSAHSRKEAVEIAKKRFVQLEGIADWHIHASTIEVERIDD